MTPMIEVESQPRIDTLVRLPRGDDARCTEYAGTVWFNGKPVVHKRPLAPPGSSIFSFSSFRWLHNAPSGEVEADVDASFFVPDSLPYSRAALGDAILSVSVLLRGSGTHAVTTPSHPLGVIIDAAASFTDDPSGSPTWIQLHVRGHVGWPAGVGYRIVALTRPEAAP